MPRTNRTRFALLGFLTQGPKTGYDLRKVFEERTSHFWSESLGQVYPTLRRLYEEGLVVREVQKQDARPDRIVYSITEEGHAELVLWIAQPSKPQPVRNEQLLKLFFASPEHAPALSNDLRRHLDRYRAQLDRFHSFENQIPQLAPTEARNQMWRLTLSLGQRILAARVGWCEEAIPVLDAISKETES